MVCWISIAFFVTGEDEVTSNAELRELQSEKLSLLQDIVGRYQAGFKKGKPVLEELLAAEHELLVAQLELADSAADRLESLNLIAINRGKLVEVRTAGHKLGTNAEIDILKARVWHVDAKIAVMHEQAASRNR